MKPDWKDAPEWAEYLAMDRDGDWYWFEFKPITSRSWWLSTGGRTECASEYKVANWDEKIEKKPH